MIQHNIINKIVQKADAEGSGYHKWYVGITNNPEKRLFEGHGVNRHLTDLWVYENAYDEQDARDTEDYLHKSYGFDGGSGGGEYDSTFVYAFRQDG